MVDPGDLVQGGTYFVVGFEDEAMTIPIIQTVIYKRPARNDEGVDVYLFDYLRVDGDPIGMFVLADDLDPLVDDLKGLICRLQGLA